MGGKDFESESSFTLAKLWNRMMVFLNKIKSSKNELLIFLAILAIASFVRFWDLGNTGFNNDEAVYSGQAATLAGYDQFSKHFSPSRAHPLLLQFIVSIVYSFSGVSDIAARTVSAIFGTATVAILYFTGKLLYNRNVAISAALITALFNYHIVVTRQVMVDVPLSFFFTLTIFFIAKYITVLPRADKSNNRNDNRKWLYAIGISTGLSFLSKEVGILALIASITFLLISKRIRVKNLIPLVFIFILVISPHIIYILSSNQKTATKFLYLEWQLNRPPNHAPQFYFNVLSMALGYLLGPLVILAVLYSVKIRKESDLLLLTFIALPFIFFQLWPTKGFHYLVSLIPALVLLVTSFLFTSHWMKKIPYYKITSTSIILLIIITTANITDNATGNLGNFFPIKDPKYLAGSGGMPKAREAALWIKDNTDEHSTILTIGPTMGNIIKFYSNRDTVYLNLSPNQSQHNPAYRVIQDAEHLVKKGQIDYIIYDKYSERRSLETADKLFYFINKYNISNVYTDYDNRRTPTGKVITEPSVMIYNNTQK